MVSFCLNRFIFRPNVVGMITPESMGSSILKFTAVPNYAKRPSCMEEGAGIRSLTDL